MRLAEIKRAVSEGLCVFRQNPSDEVIVDAAGMEYCIRCSAAVYCIKLVQSDGVTLNGVEVNFYVNKGQGS